MLQRVSPGRVHEVKPCAGATAWPINAQAAGGSFQAHRLDVVAVRIEQERRVITRAIVLTHARRAVVAAARLESVAVEPVDGGTAGREGPQANQGKRQLRIGGEPQRVTTVGTKGGGRLILRDDLVA